MASSFPGGLDSFTNPSSGDNLSTSVGGRTHSAMHADVNDALEAVEAFAVAPVAARTLATALDQGTTPARLVVLGDSTSIGTTGKWVEDLGVLIGARWPLRKVTLRTWDGTSAYGAATTIANGSATPVLDIYNGGQAGAVASYPVSRIAAMVPAAPDLVVLSFGHNHGTDSPATFEAALVSLVNAVRAVYPNAPVVVSSQNPQVSPATTPENHNARQAALRVWAAAAGFGYLPAFEAFQAQVSPSAFIQSDGVHPTTSGTNDGSALWADAGLRTLAAVSLAPVAAATGGGSSDYVYRDRLVASPGNTTLTLGATPVANSPLVWVNGAIKWQGTDYTISGSVITFGTPLSLSDVVAVQYHSAASSAAASALSGGGVSITDSFTRADSATTMGTTATGSKAWTPIDGTWGVASNKAYMASAPSSGIGLVVVDSAVADCTLSAVVSTTSGTPTCGMVFRATDVNNWYVAEITVGAAYTPKIHRRISGTLTTIATGASVTFASGDTLSVVLSGSSITVKRNGATIVSVTDSTYTTQTKHGFYDYYSPPGGASPTRFDDLSITA